MRPLAAACLAVVLLLIGGAPATPQDGRRRGRGDPDRAAAPAVGDVAPDFDLPRLIDGKADPTQRVRLSSLRGKPVALIFGSYT
jgi:hypothetical protein